MQPEGLSPNSQELSTCPYPEPDQSSPHHISSRTILILSTHLRLGLPSGLLPSSFPTCTRSSPLRSHSCYMPLPSHPPRLHYSNYTWRRVQSWSSSLCSFLHPPVTSSLVGPNILLRMLDVFTNYTNFETVRFAYRTVLLAYVGASYMSDNRQMSVAMQRLVDSISIVTNSTLLCNNTVTLY
jgi:hypothetical protein